jgi:hypothetical protein
MLGEIGRLGKRFPIQIIPAGAKEARSNGSPHELPQHHLFHSDCTTPQ